MKLVLALASMVLAGCTQLQTAYCIDGRLWEYDINSKSYIYIGSICKVKKDAE